LTRLPPSKGNQVCSNTLNRSECKKGYLARLLEIGKKALEVDAEVYHFHDPDLLFLALKLKKKGKKVIYDVHENYPGILEDTKGKLLGKFLSFSFDLKITWLEK